MDDTAERLVVLGRIAGIFGVRGELKVESYTEPRAGICDYTPWLLKRGDATDDQAVEQVVEEGRPHGKGVVVRLKGVTDIDLARALIGSQVLVPRSALPPTAEGEHYWDDLEGMRVVTVAGVELGEVDHLFETGANDVMVVKGERERLLPYIPGVIVGVDAAHRTITVDWDPEF